MKKLFKCMAALMVLGLLSCTFIACSDDDDDDDDSGSGGGNTPPPPTTKTISLPAAADLGFTEITGAFVQSDVTAYSCTFNNDTKKIAIKVNTLPQKDSTSTANIYVEGKIAGEATTKYIPARVRYTISDAGSITRLNETPVSAIPTQDEPQKVSSIFPPDTLGLYNITNVSIVHVVREGQEDTSIIATGKTKQGPVFAVKKGSTQGEQNRKITISGRPTNDPTTMTIYASAFICTTPAGKIARDNGTITTAKQMAVTFAIQAETQGSKTIGDLIATVEPADFCALGSSSACVVTATKTVNTGLSTLTSVALSSEQPASYAQDTKSVAIEGTKVTFIKTFGTYTDTQDGTNKTAYKTIYLDLTGKDAKNQTATARVQLYATSTKVYILEVLKATSNTTNIELTPSDYSLDSITGVTSLYDTKEISFSVTNNILSVTTKLTNKNDITVYLTGTKDSADFVGIPAYQEIKIDANGTATLKTYEKRSAIATKKPPVALETLVTLEQLGLSEIKGVSWNYPFVGGMLSSGKWGVGVQKVKPEAGYYGDANCFRVWGKQTDGVFTEADAIVIANASEAGDITIEKVIKPCTITLCIKQETTSTGASVKGINYDDDESSSHLQSLYPDGDIALDSITKVELAQDLLGTSGYIQEKDKSIITVKNEGGKWSFVATNKVGTIYKPAVQGMPKATVTTGVPFYVYGTYDGVQNCVALIKVAVERGRDLEQDDYASYAIKVVEKAKAPLPKQYSATIGLGTGAQAGTFTITGQDVTNDKVKFFEEQGEKDNETCLESISSIVLKDPSSSRYIKIQGNTITGLLSTNDGLYNDYKMLYVCGKYYGSQKNAINELKVYVADDGKITLKSRDWAVESPITLQLVEKEADEDYSLGKVRKDAFINETGITTLDATTPLSLEGNNATYVSIQDKTTVVAKKENDDMGVKVKINGTDSTGAPKSKYMPLYIYKVNGTFYIAFFNFSD